MIKIKNILVPTDLSDYSKHAMAYAKEFASAYGATLHLLHVVELQWLAMTGRAEYPGLVGDLVPEFEKEKEKELAAVADEIEGIQVETAVETGAPHVSVVRYAREKNIDVIVLATHGRTGLSHALIGSVAEKVVQMAPCPVLSIKHPEHEFAMP